MDTVFTLNAPNVVVFVQLTFLEHDVLLRPNRACQNHLVDFEEKMKCQDIGA